MKKESQSYAVIASQQRRIQGHLAQGSLLSFPSVGEISILHVLNLH
jgi:hypothetical protein